MMLSMVFTVLISLFNELPPLEIPDLFEQFGTVIEMFFSVIQEGLDLCIMFMGAGTVQFIGIYLGIIIIIDSFYLAYQMIWWFIKKIPMLNIKQ